MLAAKFARKLLNCYRLLFLAIALAAQEQLKEEERNYPHLTIREFGRGKTGKIAGETRDVIDSGSLYNSYWYKFLANTKSCKGEFGFEEDYASTIYLGHLSGWGYEVEPYPWVEIAVDKLDLEAMFKEIWITIE